MHCIPYSSHTKGSPGRAPRACPDLLHLRVCVCARARRAYKVYVCTTPRRRRPGAQILFSPSNHLGTVWPLAHEASLGGSASAVVAAAAAAGDGSAVGVDGAGANSGDGGSAVDISIISSTSSRGCAGGGDGGGAGGSSSAAGADNLLSGPSACAGPAILVGEGVRTSRWTSTAELRSSELCRELGSIELCRRD